MCHNIQRYLCCGVMYPVHEEFVGTCGYVLHAHYVALAQRLEEIAAVLEGMQHTADRAGRPETVDASPCGAAP
jgi:hypothetical protein